MIPPSFDYAVAASVEEAIDLLERHGDDAKILAGGHSLIPLMRLRLAAPSFLVDLGRLDGLRYIRDAGDHVAIGAMTTHYMLESSELLQGRVPLLSGAASLVGDMQVRNRGTLGGSLSHADPASDLPAAVTALGAQIVARGPSGERTAAASDFFQDIWTTSLGPSDVLTEVRIPYGSGSPNQAYEKFRVRASDWALTGAAVNIERTNGSIDSASIVLTNVGNTPVRATAAERALEGQTADRTVIDRAAQLAAEDLNPTAELKASADYKRNLARVLTRRALNRALGLA